jgi:hypothetical protein
MLESNANLETSKPNNTANSQQSTAGAQSVAKPPQGNQSNTQHEPAKPRTLAELFADKEDESSLEINLDDQTPDDPNAPIDSLDRLMKRNKLTPEQAYAIKIPMPNGAEPLTLGELKDRIGEITDHEMRVTEFEERRIQQEGELLRSQSELRSILGMLPKEAVTPQLMAKVRDTQDATIRREKQLTIQHIPQWRDEKTRTAEIEGMLETLGDYGFDASFLDTVHDHRAVKLLRDFHVMRSRIKKSLESVRDPKKLKARPSGKVGAPAKPNNKGPRRNQFPTQDQKLAAFFSSKES